MNKKINHIKNKVVELIRSLQRKIRDSFYKIKFRFSTPKLQPVIVYTVHRRYFELVNNLKRLRVLRNEFSVKPIVIVIWAAPIPEDYDIFSLLVRSKNVDIVIPRPELPGESDCTSWPESFNIRTGLEFVKLNFPQSYVIINSADSFVGKSIFHSIDNLMQSDYQLLGQTWSEMVRGSICTSFFAVSMNETLWPPICNHGRSSTLEHLWRRQLTIKPRFISGIFSSHDYEEQLRWLIANQIS